MRGILVKFRSIYLRGAKMEARKRRREDKERKGKDY